MIKNLENNIPQTITHSTENQNDTLGLKTGFNDLDKLTFGLQPSDFIIVAGRPAMGKTAFVLNIAENVAVKSDNPHSVAIFSLEMSKESLMMRFLSSVAQVNAEALRRGLLKNSDNSKVDMARERIGNAPLYICDADMTSIEIRETAKKLATKLEKESIPLSLLIIDYVGLIRVGNGQKYESIQIETSKIILHLKSLAKELNIPIIAKQKNGSLGTVELVFNKDYLKFYNKEL